MPMKSKFVKSDNFLIGQAGDTSYEYEIYDILGHHDEALHDVAVDWDFKNPWGDIKYIAISMIMTMVKNGGVGLAANQVGIPYRIFVVGFGGYAVAMINPKILDSSGDVLMQEGCLSSPGLYLKIKRPEVVNIEYYDHNGEKHIQTFSGLTARIIFHEYDHLDGIHFTEKVKKGELYFAQKKIKKNLKAVERAKAQQVRVQKTYNNGTAISPSAPQEDFASKIESPMSPDETIVIETT